MTFYKMMFLKRNENDMIAQLDFLRKKRGENT